MKKLLKQILTRLICMKNSIPYTKDSYWGIGTKVVNLGGERIFGKGIVVRPFTILYTKEKNSRLIINDYTEIGRNSTISAKNSVILGRNIVTGPNVFISDSDHNYEDVERPISLQGGSSKGNVIIDDGSWIGTNCVIIGNVHIGKHCVIGANSVVTKDIPDFTVAAGVPAKVIKQYNFDSKTWEKV